jgi:CRP/FNR family transcriptional regulator, cyclic AMP receptor protein
MSPNREGPLPSERFKLDGIKKLFLTPARRLDVMRSGGSARALLGLLPGISAKESGQDLADFLKHVQLFEDLGDGDLRRLARLVHERTYRDGEYMFEQGNPCSAMFVIRAGAIELVRRSQNGEVHLVTLEPPASLAESELLSAEAVHWCSARARGAVSVVAFGRSDVEALSHNFPLLANKLLAKLAQITALRLQMLVEELTKEPKDSE